MARTLLFTGEMQWPLDDGKQAAKHNLSVSLNYTSNLALEKVYATAVTDEVVTLPMASAKFLLLEATGNDVDIKLNGSDEVITLKAGAGFVAVWSSAGAITSVKVTVTTVPATLKGYMFA